MAGSTSEAVNSVLDGASVSASSVAASFSDAVSMPLPVRPRVATNMPWSASGDTPDSTVAGPAASARSDPVRASVSSSRE